MGGREEGERSIVLRPTVKGGGPCCWAKLFSQGFIVTPSLHFPARKQARLSNEFTFSLREEGRG
jgi:hypothetical protein